MFCRSRLLLKENPISGPLHGSSCIKYSDINSGSNFANRRGQRGCHSDAHFYRQVSWRNRCATLPPRTIFCTGPKMSLDSSKLSRDARKYFQVLVTGTSPAFRTCLSIRIEWSCAYIAFTKLYTSYLPRAYIQTHLRYDSQTLVHSSFAKLRMRFSRCKSSGGLFKLLRCF